MVQAMGSAKQLTITLQKEARSLASQPLNWQKCRIKATQMFENKHNTASAHELVC